MQADTRTQAHACTRPQMPKHSHTCPHTPTHVHTRPHMSTPTHTCPHMSTHAHTCMHMPTHAHTPPSPLQKKFLQLYIALLTIFCGGFLGNFVDNFLQLYLFCFICSTKFIHSVQKFVAHFKRGEGCVCVKAIIWTSCCSQK
jgi:hypothetical protein